VMARDWEQPRGDGRVNSVQETRWLRRGRMAQALSTKGRRRAVHEIRLSAGNWDQAVMGRDAEGRRAERGGGREVLQSSRKRRGSCSRDFPDLGAANPGGSNTTTEII